MICDVAALGTRPSIYGRYRNNLIFRLLDPPSGRRRLFGAIQPRPSLLLSSLSLIKNRWLPLGLFPRVILAHTCQEAKRKLVTSALYPAAFSSISKWPHAVSWVPLNAIYLRSNIWGISRRRNYSRPAAG